MRRVASLLRGARAHPGDTRGIAAGGRQPDVFEFGSAAVTPEVFQRAHPMHLRATHSDQPAAITRVGELVEERGCAWESVGSATAISTYAVDIAAQRVVPGDVRDVLSVWRPDWRVFDIRSCRQACGVANRRVFGIVAARSA